MHKYITMAAAAIFLAMSVSFSHARAKVYRCVAANGEISYQQFACSGGGSALDLKVHRSGWSPLRQGEKQLLQRYEKREQASRPARTAVINKADGRSTGCWKRRRQLQAVNSKLRRGYKLRESDELHRERDDHSNYLRRFCS